MLARVSLSEYMFHRNVLTEFVLFRRSDVPSFCDDVSVCFDWQCYENVVTSWVLSVGLTLGSVCLGSKSIVGNTVEKWLRSIHSIAKQLLVPVRRYARTWTLRSHSRQVALSTRTPLHCSDPAVTSWWHVDRCLRCVYFRRVMSENGDENEVFSYVCCLWCFIVTRIQFIRFCLNVFFLHLLYCFTRNWQVLQYSKHISISGVFYFNWQQYLYLIVYMQHLFVFWCKPLSACLCVCWWVCQIRLLFFSKGAFGMLLP